MDREFDLCILSVMVPADKKPLLEKALEGVSDEDLGGALWNQTFVNKADMLNATSAKAIGEGEGLAFHHALARKEG